MTKTNDAKQELLYWLSIWRQTLARAAPPYRGVNLVTVKQNSLDACLESLRLQTDYIHKIGGKLYSLTMREFDGHVKIIWCFDYPENMNWTAPSVKELSRKNAFVDCLEMFGIVESYDWYLLENGSRDFPDTSADIFCQIPPPSDEQLSELEAQEKENGNM